MAVLIDYIVKHYPWLTISWIVNSTICTLLIALVFKWLWEKRRMYILSMKLPGPLSLPILGSIPTIGSSWPDKEKMKSIMTEHLKYPSPFRIWYFTKLIVVFTDVEDVEALIENNNVSTKPNMYYFWSRGIGNGLWTGHGGTIWRKHRLLLNPAFSSKSIQSYQKIVEKRCLILKDVVAKHCTEEVCDIKKILITHSVNVLAEILLGDENLHTEQCDRLIHSMESIRTLINERLNKIWLHPDMIFKRSECNENMLQHKKFLKDYVADVFETKKTEYFKKRKTKQETDSPKTALELLIDAQNNSHHLSDEEIIEEIMSLFYKGVDSLSTAITFFVLTISMHENCRKTLTKEIDDFVNENGDVLDLQKVENLLYLKYCYKETLRLFPYSALLTKISNNDVVIKEKNITIPPGTIIAIPTYLTNFNQKYWIEPESFKPERFSIENKRQYGLYHFSLFGAGQRTCIGERMASYFVKSTMIELIKNYEIYSDAKMEDLQISYDNSVRLPSKCDVRIAKKI